MKVKDLRKFIFFNTNIKLILNSLCVFIGHANELPYCKYADFFVKSEGIYLTDHDHTMRIIIRETLDNEEEKEEK